MPPSTLTDREIITYTHQADRIATSELEVQLAERLETVLDEADEFAPIEARMDEYAVSVEDLIAYFTLFSEFGIETPKNLREKLERADAFYDIANDAGDVIARLNTLVNTTL
jgi:hypothetical protein